MQTPQRLTESGWLPILAGGGFIIVRAVVKAVLPPGWHFRFIRRYLEEDDPDDQQQKGTR